jgi:hypothetical protein
MIESKFEKCDLCKQDFDVTTVHACQAGKTKVMTPVGYDEYARPAVLGVGVANGMFATGGAPLEVLRAKALTYDDGKPPLSRVPWAAVYAMSRVQAYGHKKYKDFDNYRKGMEVTRNLSCALRHIAEYIDGHEIDPESGEPVLAHAMCRIAFVLQNLADGKAIDDRFVSRK